jgi:hypothetical protein
MLRIRRQGQKPAGEPPAPHPHRDIHILKRETLPQFFPERQDQP